MKSYFKSFLIILIMQIILWGCFISINELTSYITLASIINIILLLFYVYVYFKFEKKYTNKWKISKVKFNIFYFINWNIISILMLILISYLMNINILNGAGGLFSGIEYVLLVMFLLIPYSFIIILFKIFLWLLKKLNY